MPSLWLAGNSHTTSEIFFRLSIVPMLAAPYEEIASRGIFFASHSRNLDTNAGDSCAHKPSGNSTDLARTLYSLVLVRGLEDPTVSFAPTFKNESTH